MTRTCSWTIVAIALLAGSCAGSGGVGGGPSLASPATTAANQQVARELDLADRQGLEDATRGLVARPEGHILGPRNEVLIDFGAFRFLDGPAPATANPSLWRHAIQDAQFGLFKVTDGVFQLRGFDIANMTLFEGRRGWIVVDPLACRETAAAALAFARKHLGERPVTAIVFTHSHVDHFGGVLGVATAQEVAERQIPVVAPAGFMEEATSENILVGPAMARRSTYQFGARLERSPTGLIDTGLGANLAYGTIGILQPTQVVSQGTQELSLDGVRFVFHHVPGAEAPAELTFSVPDRKIYDGAELLSQQIHNLLPVRGAKVRDAKGWATYLEQALGQLDGIEVFVGQHNWPVWGHARIVDFITKQRDAYAYIHDQTVRLINAGRTPREIAELITLPKSLASYFATRAYYGSVRHNVKAVYQFYIGAYDGNPANLDPLPPHESARRYLALMGGAEKAVAAAQAAFDQGEYRWAAELLNQVVWGQPDSKAAKLLLAQTYEQLGYQAESATFRNSYLTAAKELRLGAPKAGPDRSKLFEMLRLTPTEKLLDAMAAGLDGPAADGKTLKINLVLADPNESFVLWIENAVLHHKSAPPDAGANATLRLTKEFLVNVVTGSVGIAEAVVTDSVKVSGSRIDLVRFFSLFERASGNFPIVTR